MNIIVPLAGPDFIGINGVPKAMNEFRGGYQILKILENRPWFDLVQSRNYTFVLYDCIETREFAKFLTKMFPDCSTVFYSNYTQGAALTCLGAVPMIQNNTSPLIIDLADIFYTSEFDILKVFESDSSVQSVVPYFNSNNKFYSYFEFNDDGMVIDVEEKNLISKNASAGTYIFRNSNIFIKCLSYALENNIRYNQLFYVAPILKAICVSQHVVKPFLVTNIDDPKMNQ